MTRIAAAAIAAFLLCASPAVAQDTCANEAAVTVQIKQAFPGSSVQTPRGEEAANFLANIEKVSGQKSPGAEAVLIFTNPDYPVAVIILFRDGCAKELARVPLPVVKTLLGAP